MVWLTPGNRFMFKSLALLAAIAALSAPAAAFAQLDWGSYDTGKTIKVTAPLTQLVWEKPNVAAKIRYGGKIWDVILAPPERMEASGLTQSMLSSTRPVRLEGYPRVDGAAEMRVERITVGGTRVELR